MAEANSPHKVVIIGGGFGGMLCAQGLAKAPVEITLIDRRNFHLFQPLLYQVATGGLSPANIAAPLRSIFKSQRNVRVVMAEVSGFDLQNKQVLLNDGSQVPFDSLVVAAGATHHYFGKDAAWESIAPGLKTIEDATEIRRKVLGAFERAEKNPNIESRGKQLTFVVVGGGPTGVEMAGSIAELARQTLRRDFRNIDPSSARVILVENGPKVLQMFAEKLSDRALKSLQEVGVEVVLNTRVTDIQPDHVKMERGGTVETVPTETVVWAAGVKASPLGKLLADAAGPGVVLGRAGHVAVNRDCSIPGFTNIFVVGDLASHTGADGKLLPGVAPVAMQQGTYVAETILRRIKGDSPKGPFQYWDKGSMATIGRSHAVAESMGFKFSGRLAWLAWLFIHIMYLARFENRILVVFQWFWNYVSRNRTARLITNVEK